MLEENPRHPQWRGVFILPQGRRQQCASSLEFSHCFQAPCRLTGRTACRHSQHAISIWIPFKVALLINVSWWLTEVTMVDFTQLHLPLSSETSSMMLSLTFCSSSSELFARQLISAIVDELTTEVTSLSGQGLQILHPAFARMFYLGNILSPLDINSSSKGLWNNAISCSVVCVTEKWNVPRNAMLFRATKICSAFLLLYKQDTASTPIIGAQRACFGASIGHLFLWLSLTWKFAVQWLSRPPLTDWRRGDAYRRLGNTALRDYLIWVNSFLLWSGCQPCKSPL